MLEKKGYPYKFDENACKIKCKALCCVGEGFVFLDKDEIKSIAQYLNLDTETFKKLYTKKAVYGHKTVLIDLKIKGRLQCVFLDSDNKCEVYPVRPKQCRAFPFWEHLKNRKKDELKKLCPGIVYADK